MATDRMEIEILDDGTIRVLTDRISGPNHQSAEAFTQELGRLAGGETTRTRRTDTERPQHQHDHLHH